MKMYIVYECTNEWGDYMPERRKRKLEVFRTLEQARNFCEGHYLSRKGKNARGYDIELEIQEATEVTHWEITNNFHFKI